MMSNNLENVRALLLLVSLTVLSRHIDATDNRITIDLLFPSVLSSFRDPAVLDLATTLPALVGAVDLSVHYFVWDGRAWGCNAPEEPCATQCVKGGVYCHPDPDYNLFGGTSGADVVQETLRQLCIFQQASADNNTVALDWWTYVIRFSRLCSADPSVGRFNEACSRQVHDTIPNLQWDVTARCMTQSWTSGYRNTLLDREMAWYKAHRLSQMPQSYALWLNGSKAVNSSLSSMDVAQLLCAAGAVEDGRGFCQCVTTSVPSRSVADCVCPSDTKYCVVDRQCHAKTSFDQLCHHVVQPTSSPTYAITNIDCATLRHKELCVGSGAPCRWIKSHKKHGKARKGRCVNAL